MLFEDSYSCVVWARNLLVKDSLSLEKYMALGHVATVWGNRQQPSFEEWFLKSTGLSRSIAVSVGNFNTLPQLVIGTNRVATLQTRLARMSANYYPLRLVPPPMEIPALVEKMQWHKFLDKDPAHVWFRELMARVANSETRHVEGY